MLLQTSPCLRAGTAGARTPSDGRTILSNLLTANAAGLNSAPNAVFGFGRIDAFAAASQTIPTATISASSNQTATGSSSKGTAVSFMGSGSDPNSCPLQFSWTGPCGTANTQNATLQCPLGTSTEALQVSNNGVTMSSPSTVQVTVTDFSVSALSAAATVNAGQSANFSLAVEPRFGAFNAAVALSCSNSPPQSTCEFSPSSVTPASANATSSLTVTTKGPNAILLPPSRSGPAQIPIYAAWLLFPGMLLVSGALRKRFAMCVAVVALFALILFQMSCGGGSGNGSSSQTVVGGTPAGTYTVQVVGTSASLSRSTTVTLTVQ